MRILCLKLVFLIFLSLVSTLAYADEPLEYKLAAIDTRAGGSLNDLTVARFNSLLNQLSRTYVENKQEIADSTVRAQELLLEHGIIERMLNIMDGLNQLFSKPISNQKYVEYVAAYVTLRQAGQSHSQAINGLKAILQEFGIY